jgi:hypothetical protein
MMSEKRKRKRKRKKKSKRKLVTKDSLLVSEDVIPSTWEFAVCRAKSKKKTVVFYK